MDETNSNSSHTVVVILVVVFAIVAIAYMYSQSHSQQNPSTRKVQTSTTIDTQPINTSTNIQSNQSFQTQQSQQAQTKTQTTQTNISIKDISINGIILAPTGGGYITSGGSSDYNLIATVTNNSAYPLRYIVATVEAYDCPTYTLEPSCSHIGEDTKINLFIQNDTSAQIPSDQTREMEGGVYLGGMPPINGHFVWTYSITKAGS